MLNITTGIIRRPVRMVIFGPEGIGKTSLSTHAPNPLLMDIEDGSTQLDVRRINNIQSWEEAMAIIEEVTKTPGICETFVVDTVDRLEQLCIKYVCTKFKQSSLEAFPYGRGYNILGEEFTKFLAACDQVIAAGINVIIVAHAKMRKFEQPDEMGSYDRWELKLTRQVSPLIKEWSDLLLFANYQTVIVTSENNTRKPTGGKRVMYASHHPAWDAKNRFNLPDVMDLDFSCIAHIFGKADPAPEQPKPIDQLRALMAEAGITDAQLQKVVASKGHYPADAAIDTYEDKFITGWCIKHFAAITNMIKEDQNNG